MRCIIFFKITIKNKLEHLGLGNKTNKKTKFNSMEILKNTNVNLFQLL